MSCLHFHSSSASSGTLRGATSSSDTTEDDEGRAATPTKKMDPAATYAAIVALFFAAGVLEIGGGWMWWQALREGKPWWYALIGSAMLCLYGVVPTFQPQTAGTEDFGRVYAAYGCWFIMLSLAWGWAIDGNRPDAGDGIGAVVVKVMVQKRRTGHRTSENNSTAFTDSSK